MTKLTTMTSASNTIKEVTNNDNLNSSTNRSHGGRHRIFTEEQRKVRNRQAQAAFRERRSQYTQTLQETILGLEKIITELQESNRNTSVRAEIAEQRCIDLEKQNDILQQLISTVTAENQRLLQQQLPNKQQPQTPSSFIAVPETFGSESSSVTEEEINETPTMTILSQQQQEEDACKSLTGE
ncbi:hypothetical protein INT45_001957 [Circinella minor]|uniref:BZIP domain-containing protein n=1 Tax=Circinella minor TaxID=1195481 RepID=A0A8H7VPA9_9FUNG|nr:hypothetical protein INT45_001957 [Circinella minor]